MWKKLALVIAVQMLLLGTSFAENRDNKKEQERAKSAIIKEKQDLYAPDAKDRESAEQGDENDFAEEEDREVNDKQVPSPYPVPQVAPPLSREATTPAL